MAAARSAIQQGAALVPALAFMFASTNLVIELGAVLWVLAVRFGRSRRRITHRIHVVVDTNVFTEKH